MSYAAARPPVLASEPGRDRTPPFDSRAVTDGAVLSHGVPPIDSRTLHSAGRGATLVRLVRDSELPERAEAWIARWEAQATAEGRPRDGRYWDDGYRWITERIGSSIGSEP